MYSLREIMLSNATVLLQSWVILDSVASWMHLYREGQMGPRCKPSRELSSARLSVINNSRTSGSTTLANLHAA